MLSLAHDSRFDEAEADVDHGTPWMFREPDAPNPLTISVTDWSKGVTKLGPAEWMNGVDRDGRRWSILVGSVVLTKRLIEGLEEAWDDTKDAFIVKAVHGRVQPGDVVSIKYLGDVQGEKYLYPNFAVSRKPPVDAADETVHAPIPDAEVDAEAAPRDGIPY